MTPPPTRPESPLIGGEREQLNGFLDFQRATVVWKATGLSDEQARRPLVASRLTAVAPLLSHLRYVERYWFSVVFEGREDTWAVELESDPDIEFRVGLDAPLSRLIEEYEAECALNREIAARHDLDATGSHRGEPVNLRWVLVHMVEETARHAGHLDLLRENIDGETGE
ncbi:MAG TPA: DinB family protein [Actinophytocola sp.]|jgi:uncharacterized damage-inducible protein DinB|uniref:DinB family protein n=1 Tax=Actinophytocola sp. TaxID=1872138 RepID=UPI002F935D84